MQLEVALAENLSDRDIIGRERFADLGSDEEIVASLQRAGVLRRKDEPGRTAALEVLHILDEKLPYVVSYVSTQRRGGGFAKNGNPATKRPRQQSDAAEEEFEAPPTYSTYATNRLHREDVALQRAAAEVAQDAIRQLGEAPTAEARNPGGIFLVLTRVAELLEGQRQERDRRKQK